MILTPLGVSRRRISHKKGISNLIAMVLYTAIILGAVILVLNMGMPLMNKMKDTVAIQRSLSFLSDLDKVIKEVATGHKYSSREISLNFQKGSFHRENSSFVYEIETNSDIISTHGSKKIGNIVMASNAESRVYKSKISGINCYMMENQYLKVCIRDISPVFNYSRKVKGFWHFNEDKGQRANDSSEFGKDLILGGELSAQTSDPLWSDECVYKSCLKFDGKDDYLYNGGNNLDFGSSKNLTISAWLKGNWGGTQNIIHIGSRGSDQEGAIKLSIANSGKLRAYLYSGGWKMVESNNSLNEGSWNFVVASYRKNGSSTKVQVGINGFYENSSQIPGEVNISGPISIGASNGSSNWLNGSIDEIRVLDIIPSAENLKWQYRSKGKPNYINTSGLLVYYYNKKLGLPLNMKLEVKINNRTDTIAGTGHTEAENLRDNLGRGRIKAYVNSSSGLNYTLNFDLISGADFLKVNVK